MVQDSWMMHVYRYRKMVWLIFTTVLLSSLWSLRNFGVDNSVEVWFPQDSPKLAVYQDFQERFGNDEMVMIGVQNPHPILSQEGMQWLNEVHQITAQTEGIASVRSLVNTHLTNHQMALLSDFLQQEVDIKIIEQDPLVQPFLGKDDHVTILMAQMAQQENMDSARDGILANLRDRLKNISSEGIHYGGIGVVYAALNHAATIGAAGVMALSYIFIATLMWIFTGNWRTVVLILGGVGTSVIILMGLFTGLGSKLNMVNMVVPTLSLVIGVSSAIHMLMHIQLYRDRPLEERLQKGLGGSILPCLANALTTALGFAALYSSDMPVVQELGLYGALGVLIAFVVGVLAMVTFADFVSLLPTPSQKMRMTGLVEVIATWSYFHYRMVLGIFLSLSVGALWGMGQLQVDTYSIGFLPPDHVARQDSDWLEQNYGLYTPLEFVVNTDAEHFVSTLQSIEQWEKSLAKDASVGQVYSLVQPISLMNQSLQENPALGIPDDEALLDQLLFLYKMQAPEQVAHLLQEDEQMHLRLSVFSQMDSAKGFEQQIQSLLQQGHFSEPVQVQASGYIPLYVAMMDNIVTSQVSSFAIAFVIIMSVLGMLFRDWQLLLLSIPSNLFPVMMTLGLMGVLGIPLDVATVTVAALVFGLVVDDTIQFLYRLQQELKVGTTQEAAHQTVLKVGKPMLMTTMILALGFSTLMLAEVTSVAYFGGLLAFALLSALFGDLLLLPALLHYFKPHTEIH